MRAKGATYLPLWDKESDASWKARRDSSFLFGAYDQAVTGHSGRLFSKSIVLGDDVPDKIREWWENIDLGGQHGDIFSAGVFSSSLDPGVGFILTDAPVTEKQLTRAEEQELGVRPYCTYIPAEDVLGWRTKRIAGAEVLTMVRILEETVEEDGDWGEAMIRRVRVFYHKGEFISYELHKEIKEGEESKWELEEGGELRPAKRIPLRPFYARRSGFFTGLPWMQAMAEKNLEHWQSASDQRAALHFARVSALKAIGMQPDDLKVKSFGHGSVLFCPSSDGDIEWLTYPVGGATIGERDLEKIEEQLSILGLEPLLHKPGDPTATAKSINEARATSRLLQAGRAYADTVEGVFADMAMWAKIEDGGGSVSMNEDFGLELADSAELTSLVEARKNGDISRETMWSEFKRRGVLMADFDAEKETQRLDIEEGILTEEDAVEPRQPPGSRPEMPMAAT